MNILEFIKTYSYESSCKKKFIEYRHEVAIVCSKCGEKEYSWVHIAISNARRQLLNSYHNIKPEFLQNYLDEFYYKFYRRYLVEVLFNRLSVASVFYKNEFRYICR